MTATVAPPLAARPLGAPGHMGVDYEERVDFARLRDYRIGRAKAALEASGCGAFLLPALLPCVARLSLSSWA